MTSAQPAVEPSRYLVSIHHPAQVHFFRYVIDELDERGHEVLVCARDKEVTAELLEAFDIPHTLLGTTRSTLPGLAVMQATYELRLLREARRFRPDVMTSIGGLEISHVAPLVGARALAFDDTAATVARLLTFPPLDLVCTPAGFETSVRGPRREYEGYHELAYLHPDRFEPSKDRLRAAGVEPDEPLFLLRFSAWNATHDRATSGLSRETKRDLVDSLSHRGTVYVSSESPLPAEFRPYRLPIPPDLVHDLLAFADLYVGDSGTMSTEAAVLGTPSIRANSAADHGDLSNFVELERQYGLMYSFADDEKLLEKVHSLLADAETGARWQRRRRRMLEDKIDVTTFAVAQLEALAREQEAGRRARTPVTQTA